MEPATVRREQERLQRELSRHQSLVRVTQRHLGLVAFAGGRQEAAAGEKKGRAPTSAAKQLEKRAGQSVCLSSG